MTRVLHSPSSSDSSYSKANCVILVAPLVVFLTCGWRYRRKSRGRLDSMNVGVMMFISEFPRLRFELRHLPSTSESGLSF